MPASAKTWVFKPIDITGERLQPKSFHLVQRKSLKLKLHLNDPRIDRDLLKQVADAVKHAPF